MKTISIEWYIEKHAEACEKLKSITAQKVVDYSGARDHPFDNFMNVEALGITTTEIGYLTRMVDKITRIASIITTGKQAVMDESVEDTLLDLANYSISLATFIKARKDGLV